MAHRSPGADSTNENGSTRMSLLEVTEEDGAGPLPAAINDVFISRGLTNTGNTCWLNSALQGVCSTPGLKKAVLLNPQSASCTASLDERAKCMSCQLELLLMALADIAHTRADWRLAAKRSAAQQVAAMLADDSTTELDEDGAGAGPVLVANPSVPANKQQQNARQAGSLGHRAGRRKQRSRIRRSRIRRLINMLIILPAIAH
jgi:hypothetical protein